MKKILFFFGAIFLSFNSSLWSQSTTMDHSKGDHVLLNGMDLKWGDAPPGLPKGAKVAVLSGDPTKEGMFTLRATFPANYKIFPHWHPTVEHITVVEGTLYMGMAEKFDESKATELKAGGYAVMPAKSAHYAFSKDGCTIQVHAMGPFQINYINASDDPRKQ